MMMQRFAKGPEMLKLSKHGMKSEAEDMVNSLGIKFEFFDKKGQFAGLDAMFKELEKFKLIEAKYGQKGKSIVADALFGTEASRPAMLLAEYGWDGYQKALARMDDQASLDERMKTKLLTLKSKEEAAGGTWENTKAAAARGFGEGKKKTLDAINDFLSNTVQPTLERHPGLGTGAITTAAAGTGIAATAGAGLALSGMASTQVGLAALAGIPGAAAAFGLLSKIPVIPKGAGLFGLAASGAGALLSSVAGEESAGARYGAAALSGAGLGATVGSIVPVIGTGVGAGIGAIGGLIVQGISDALKPAGRPADQAATQSQTMKAELTVGLAPGLVIQGQSVRTSGADMHVNTGNIHTGAPG
jgi:hypothetical protein